MHGSQDVQVLWQTFYVIQILIPNLHLLTAQINFSSLMWVLLF
jgi:hypothetical protein